MECDIDGLGVLEMVCDEERDPVMDVEGDSVMVRLYDMVGVEVGENVGVLLTDLLSEILDVKLVDSVGDMLIVGVTLNDIDDDTDLLLVTVLVADLEMLCESETDGVGDGETVIDFVPLDETGGVLVGVGVRVDDRLMEGDILATVECDGDSDCEGGDDASSWSKRPLSAGTTLAFVVSVMDIVMLACDLMCDLSDAKPLTSKLHSS